jgi:3-oxoacyl-(acyl-carrier-protein) synthase
MINHTLSLPESKIRVAALQNFAFGGVNTWLFAKRFG